MTITSESSIDQDDDNFPTAVTLRQANNEFGKSKTTYDDDGLPLPCPAVRTKKEVFDISLFKELDDKACQAPATLLTQPLEQLVQYLIKGTKTELERVRVIFRWITAQNLAKLDDRNVSRKPTSALEYLIGIKSNTTSYHTLLTDMCRLANIVTKEVNGYVKHSEYEIGASFTEESRNWTAVLIDQMWFLVDAHCSSKHVSGFSGEWQLLDDNGHCHWAKETKETSREEHYQYNENYFLTSPEELIYSHFPQDSRWQLLARKITIEEFQQMAYLKLPFFQCGLQIVSHKKCTIEAPESLVSVQLGYRDLCKFMYRLWISSKDGQHTLSGMFNDVALSRFVFMENRGGMMTCDIRFPIAGKFKLDLLCKTASMNTYKGVCSYVINATTPAKIAKPYPENDRSEWGPGQDLHDVGLQPITHPEGFIESEKGETVIRFKADNPVEILAKLHTDKKTDEQMSDYVIHYIKEDEIVLNVKMPEKDDYVLNIYAKKDDIDAQADRKFASVCSYMISSLEPAADPRPFPKIANGRLGPAKRNSSFKIKPVSHPASLLTSPDDGSQMDFIFQVSKFCELLAELEHHQDGSGRKMKGYTMVSGTSSDSSDISTVSTRFPQIGQYILNIYAKNTKEPSDDKYNFAYRYMIQVNRATNPCFLFPKKYSSWTSACQLIEPDINQPINARSKTRFRVDIPNAVEVAVIRADKWTHLAERGPVWTGEIETGNVGDVLKLNAKFSADSESFECLLEFQVVELIAVHDDDEDDSSIVEVKSESGKNIRSRSALMKSTFVSEPITEVQSEPIVNKPPRANLTKESNIETRKKVKKSKHKLRKLPPVKTGRATAKPRPIDKDIVISEKWKEEFLNKEDKKLMGEKSFRIKKTQERAPKLHELNDSVTRMRSARIKPDQRRSSVRRNDSGLIRKNSQLEHDI